MNSWLILKGKDGAHPSRECRLVCALAYFSAGASDGWIRTHQLRIVGRMSGATTHSIMTFSIMTPSIMTLSIMKFSIMTLSILMLSLMDLIVALSINDTEHNDTWHKN